MDDHLKATARTEIECRVAKSIAQTQRVSTQENGLKEILFQKRKKNQHETMQILDNSPYCTKAPFP